MRLIPAVGYYELNDLTPIVLQKFISKLLVNGNIRTGAGLAASSVNAIITVMQNSLYIAHSLGLNGENAGKKLKRPKVVEEQILCFSKEEQRKIEYQ